MLLWPLAAVSALGLEGRRAQKDCTVLYVEGGTNDGEVLSRVLNNEPELELAVALTHAAGGPYAPSLACVHGFEPNPSWTPKLTNLSSNLGPLAAELVVHTERALVADHRENLQIFHQRDCAHGVCDSIRKAGQAATAQDASTVAAENMVDWLWAAVRQRPRASVVLRLDIETEEYNVLPALAVSGIGPWLAARDRCLIVLVEWHVPGSVTAMEATRPLSSRLDSFYGFAVKKRKMAASSLVSVAEKAAAFYLHQASIPVLKILLRTQGVRSKRVHKVQHGPESALALRQMRQLLLNGSIGQTEFQTATQPYM